MGASRTRTLRRRVRRAQAALLHRFRGLTPAPREPRHTAPASMFFDAYPRFFETSTTSASRARLNLRYEAIFAENRDVFAGARVLDIASHDGRWSFAALKTGAAEVVGIEAREDLVEAARANLAHYGEDESRFRFIGGDVLDVLRTEKLDVDVVLCLGFLYHTLRYGELMRRIRDLEPRHLLVDTQVIPGERARVVQLAKERVESQSNAAEDPYTYRGRALIGIPSVSALKFLMRTYDFEVERFSDWRSLLSANPGVRGIGGYARGGRVTARCVSTATPESSDGASAAR